MQMRTMLTSACAALLIPLVAGAKPPGTTADCQVLVPQAVSRDTPFNITVVRDPEFPGQWFSPTVTVEVFIPLTSPRPNNVPDFYSQSVTQTTLGLLGPNRATAVFVIPSPTSVLTALNFVDTQQDMMVVATVSEPVNGRKTRDAVCDATIAFQ